MTTIFHLHLRVTITNRTDARAYATVLCPSVWL